MMTDMDYVQVMKELKSLLKSHDKAVRQIFQLDHYIADQNNRLMKLTQMKRTNQAIKMMDRKTTAENVRHMFKCYQQNKWSEILQVANRIMLSMQTTDASANEMQSYNDTQLEVDAIVDRVRRVNRLAMVQTCEFTRNS